MHFSFYRFQWAHFSAIIWRTTMAVSGSWISRYFSTLIQEKQIEMFQLHCNSWSRSFFKRGDWCCWAKTFLKGQGLNGGTLFSSVMNNQTVFKYLTNLGVYVELHRMGGALPLLPPDIENAPPCAPPSLGGGGEHSKFPRLIWGGQIQFGGEHLNFQNFAPPCAPPHFFWGGEHL